MLRLVVNNNSQQMRNRGLNLIHRVEEKTPSDAFVYHSKVVFGLNTCKHYCSVIFLLQRPRECEVMRNIAKKIIEYIQWNMIVCDPWPWRLLILWSKHAEKTLNARLQFFLQLANKPESLVNAFEALVKNSGTILSSLKHYT